MGTALALLTRSAEETHALGAAVGHLLRGGDVVALAGDLGAGKTTFVQGAASSLGVREPVLSPTFTLVREYEAPLPVIHLDVYRLERLQDVVDLGFDDLLDRAGIVFVEWGDAIDALLPPSSLLVRITIPADDEDRREVAVQAHGPDWDERRAALDTALRPWRVT